MATAKWQPRRSRLGCTGPAAADALQCSSAKIDETPTGVSAPQGPRRLLAASPSDSRSQNQTADGERTSHPQPSSAMVGENLERPTLGALSLCVTQSASRRALVLPQYSRNFVGRPCRGMPDKTQPQSLVRGRSHVGLELTTMAVESTVRPSLSFCG